jgi:hypothetical protein
MDEDKTPKKDDAEPAKADPKNDDQLPVTKFL